MNDWILVDCMNPLEEDEESPHEVICSESELRQALDRLRQRPPSMVFLDGPDAQMLELRIGGPFAALRWHRKGVGGGVQVTRTALAPSVSSDREIEFLAEGLPTPTEPEQLFLSEEVIEAALYFYREQRLPDWLAWEQWNPTTKQWDTIPATRPAPVGVLAK